MSERPEDTRDLTDPDEDVAVDDESAESVSGGMSVQGRKSANAKPENARPEHGKSLIP